MQDAVVEDNGYEQYQKLGGIINEKDYQSALARVRSTTTLDAAPRGQSEIIAQVAGIELSNSMSTLDPRTILYGILRADTNPEGARYHHSQMCDQRLFAEVLRMLGDADSLKKLIKAHPHISFD